MAPAGADAELASRSLGSQVGFVKAFLQATGFRRITRAKRVETHKDQIFSNYDEKLQEFLGFVLDQYVQEGVGELDQDKLPGLLRAKYYNINDGAAELGGIENIRNTFVGFQQYLYG